MVCLSRLFKGCLLQILLGPFLNNLTHMVILLLGWRFLIFKKSFVQITHWKICEDLMIVPKFRF